MTINFFYERIQQQNERGWEIVAEFAALTNGFSYREFAGTGDFLLKLRDLQIAVNAMVAAAERL